MPISELKLDGLQNAKKFQMHTVFDIWSSCRSTGHLLLLVFGSQMTLFPVKCIVGLVFIVDI